MNSFSPVRACACACFVGVFVWFLNLTRSCKFLWRNGVLGGVVEEANGFINNGAAAVSCYLCSSVAAAQTMLCHSESTSNNTQQQQHSSNSTIIPFEFQGNKHKWLASSLSLDSLNGTVAFLGFMLVWNSLCIGFFLFGGFIYLFSILLHNSAWCQNWPWVLYHYLKLKQ